MRNALLDAGPLIALFSPGDRHRRHYEDLMAGFAGKPVERGIGQIHFAFARFGVTPHPAQHVVKMTGIEGMNFGAAHLYPLQHLKIAGRIEQMRGLDDARPRRQQSQARGRETCHQVFVTPAVAVAR